MKSRNCNRYQCWDEENRLTAVRDVAELSQLSVYLYDGGGERAWKLTGQEMETKLSGKTVYTNVSFDKTLYSSPLMVVTDQEYTKHYFIEGERVCTKIGGGFWGTAPFMPNGTPVGMLYGTLPEFTYHLSVMTGRHIECTGYDGQWDISPSFAHLLNKTNMPESNQYFYHSDHLGSASFVTDATGYVDQHIQYLPFGELFISQRNSTFDSRYKFTAKELDNETQYTYFGARYYDSDVSIWLSVDPLSDKYPSMSAYMYCAGNPVILVDPDGMRINRANSVGLRDYRRSLKSTKEGREIWKGMKRSSTLITVIYSNDAIVDQTSNGHFVLSGAYLHDAYTTTRNRGRNSRGQTKTETYFRNGTVYVSMGTYQAQQEIMQIYGVSNWSDLTDGQKQAGLQQVLSSGNYTIRNINDWSIVTPNNINIATGSNPDADYIITPPIDGETRQQYSERVSAHEGRHSVNANWFTSIYNRSRSEYRDRQERSAYRTESKVINEQLSR